MELTTSAHPVYILNNSAYENSNLFSSDISNVVQLPPG